jgi:hypothetical protein
MTQKWPLRLGTQDPLSICECSVEKRLPLVRLPARIWSSDDDLQSLCALGTNRSNRKQPFSFSKRLYKLRWRIESAFNRLKDFRRIATQYDKLALNYLASVCLAAALVWWIMNLDPSTTLADFERRGIPKSVFL